MKLRHRKTLDAPLNDVYDAFMDVPRIGRCFPGAAVTSWDGQAFTGLLTVKIGPFKLHYEGAGEMSLRDREGGQASLWAKGGEKHGLGKADMSVTLSLEEIPGDPERCVATLETGLDVKGSPTNLGGGIAQKISEPLVYRFLDNMAGPDTVDTYGPDDEPLDIGKDIIGGLVSSAGKAISGLLRR